MTPEMTLATMLSSTQTVIDKTTVIEKTASAEKTAAAEKLAWADEMGRELAREHMEKQALFGVSIPNAVTPEAVAAVAHGDALQQKALAAAKRSKMVKSLGSKGLKVGAGAAALAAGAAAARHATNKPKTAAPLSPLMAGAQKAVGQGIHATMGATKAMRMGAGAAGGATLGAVGGALKDPGQGGSRFGNMAAGAVGGAALGAGAGAGAKRGLQMVGGSKGAVGQATRNAMSAGVRTGNAVKDVSRTQGLTALSKMPPKPAPVK